MAGGIQQDEDQIFSGGNEPLAGDIVQLDPAPTEKTPEDAAVSQAISALAREGGRNPTRTVPQIPAPQPPPQQQPQPQGQEGGEDRSQAGILRALLDEREKRQRYEQQLQRYQQQEEQARQQAAKPPIDQRLFEKPQEVLDELRQQIMSEAVTPLQQRMQEMAVQHDMTIASLRHQEIWNDAWQNWYQTVGTGQDPVTYFRVMNAPSPGEELVTWFREQQLRQEVGDDPKAYRERVRQELLAEMNGQAAPTPQPGPTPPRDASGQFVAPKQQVRLPTPTSRMGSNGPGGNAEVLDGSDDAIFEAARPQRRK